MSKEEAKAVRAEKLVKLFKTELGQRMVKAHSSKSIKKRSALPYGN